MMQINGPSLRNHQLWYVSCQAISAHAVTVYIYAFSFGQPANINKC